MGKVADAIETLEAGAASMSGDDLENLLIRLGFKVRAGSSGSHQVVTHDGLDGFLSTSFDKGHKKQMLPVYPRNIKRIIKQYQGELEKFLGEKDNGET